MAYDTVLESAGNDFMCIRLRQDTLSAVWGDTRSGRLNIWFQRMRSDGTLLSRQQLAGEETPQIKIYPNPASDFMQMEAPLSGKLSICDMKGQVLRRLTYNRLAGPLRLDLRDLSPGSYFLQLETEMGPLSRKFIKAGN